MARDSQRKKIVFTKHFEQRLFERWGIVLTDEEKDAIYNGIINTFTAEQPKQNIERFDVILKHKNIKMLLIMQGKKIVTAHCDRKMPRKKFLKWNSGRINKKS